MTAKEFKKRVNKGEEFIGQSLSGDICVIYKSKNIKIKTIGEDVYIRKNGNFVLIDLDNVITVNEQLQRMTDMQARTELHKFILARYASVLFNRLENKDLNFEQIAKEIIQCDWISGEDKTLSQREMDINASNLIKYVENDYFNQQDKAIGWVKELYED